jgi:hypothetical protein
MTWAIGLTPEPAFCRVAFKRACAIKSRGPQHDQLVLVQSSSGLPLAVPVCRGSPWSTSLIPLAPQVGYNRPHCVAHKPPRNQNCGSQSQVYATAGNGDTHIMGKWGHPHKKKAQPSSPAKSPTTNIASPAQFNNQHLARVFLPWQHMD